MVAWLIGLRGELLLVALQGLRRELGGRLQLLELGEVIVRLELQQHLAGRAPRCRIELDLIHHAGGLRGQIRAAHGAQRADGCDLRLPRGLRRPSPWRRSAAPLAACSMNFLIIDADEGLPAEHAAEHQRDDQHHDDRAA